MKSPSQRAGQNILGIKDDVKNDSFEIGKAFHHYCQTKNKDEAYNMIGNVEDKEVAVEKLDNLINNFNKSGVVIDGENEVFVKGDLFTFPFVAYLDNVSKEGMVFEFKSTSSLSTPEDKPAMRQAVNSREEYKIQARVYMKLTGKDMLVLLECVNTDPRITERTRLKKEQIIECCKDFDINDSKLTIKDIVKKYSPEKKGSQVIVYNLTEEFDREMTQKYKPIVEEMMRFTLKYRQAPTLPLD